MAFYVPISDLTIKYIPVLKCLEVFESIFWNAFYLVGVGGSQSYPAPKSQSLRAPPLQILTRQPGNVQVSSRYLGSRKDVSNIPSPTESTKAIWKSWAATCQRSGTPTIVQICHAGRQSPFMAGNRGFFDKNIAPSAVPLRFGDSFIERAAAAFMFGTPRELTADEISGPGGIIDEFVGAAKQTFEAGFKGVELHGA